MYVYFIIIIFLQIWNLAKIKFDKVKDHYSLCIYQCHRFCAKLRESGNHNKILITSCRSSSWFGPFSWRRKTHDRDMAIYEHNLWITKVVNRMEVYTPWKQTFLLVREGLPSLSPPTDVSFPIFLYQRFPSFKCLWFRVRKSHCLHERKGYSSLKYLYFNHR